MIVTRPTASPAPARPGRATVRVASRGAPDAVEQSRVSLAPAIRVAGVGRRPARRTPQEASPLLRRVPEPSSCRGPPSMALSKRCLAAYRLPDPFSADCARLVVYPAASSQVLTTLAVLRAFWEADVRTAHPMTTACWQEAPARGARTPRHAGACRACDVPHVHHGGTP